MWYIAHYGVGHLQGGNSGRYPWGSGDRPYQGAGGSGAVAVREVSGPASNQKLKTWKQTAVENAHIIPKGTKMYRATTNPNEQTTGSTYVTFRKEDRDFYKNYIGERDRKQVYEKEFKLKEDLKVPSQNELKEVYAKAMSDEKLKNDAISSYLNQVVEANVGKIDNYADMYKDYKKLNTTLKGMTVEDIIDTCYRDGDKVVVEDWNTGETRRVKCTDQEFSNWYYYDKADKITNDTLSKIKDKRIDDFQLAASSLAGAEDVKDYVINELRNRGYNAMVDEAGVGVQKDPSGRTLREGSETLIIFDSNSMKEKKTKEVSYKDRVKARGDYQRWRNKAGVYRYT